MGYNDNVFFTRETKKAIGEFTAFICGAVVVIAILLTTAFFGKQIIWPNHTPPCLKHHQQVEQVNDYGKKEAITVCDQFRGEPVTEPAK